MNSRKEIKINKEWSAIIACNYIENVVMVSFFHKGLHVIAHYYRCFFNDYTSIVYDSVIEVFDKLLNVNVDRTKVFKYLEAFDKIAKTNETTLITEGAISFDDNGDVLFLTSDVNKVDYGA